MTDIINGVFKLIVVLLLFTSDVFDILIYSVVVDYEFYTVIDINNLSEHVVLLVVLVVVVLVVVVLVLLVFIDVELV